MTFEQANNMIDDISWSYGGEIITNQDMIECRETCHEALEKQIPKKPTPDNKYFGFGICPTCNAVFFDNSTKHCGNCGQALDWSEFIEQGRKELEKLGIVKLHR